MANKHRTVWKVVTWKLLFEKQTQLKGKTLFWKPNQIFLWLESVFRWPTFLMANKYRTVWKVVTWKPLFGKQTQLKGKTLFWKLNQIFLWLKSVFRWPESVFRWLTFLMTNKYRKVWKVISRKVNSEKQTWAKKLLFL
jgi:hypothetical protein